MKYSTYVQDNDELGGILKPCGPLRGRGGFQIVHVSPQGGKGVKEMIYVNIPEGGI